jgi:hypothetical protein
MASRVSPMSAKAHTANVRERKKYLARVYGPMPVSKTTPPKLKGAARIVLELAYRARLKARDPAAWETRCAIIPMAARNAWCR